MINKVTILGRVGKDPDIRMSASGTQIANITIATSEFWRDKNGDKQEKTEWHRVVVFNDKLISNIIEKYVKKGSLVYIEGALQTRKYTDAQGVEKYSTEIVLKGYSDVLKLISTGGSASSGQVATKSSTSNESYEDQEMADVTDDEIPF
jgi:single-strand DNA-binding protein